MNVLVTGGAGYIGSHTAKALAEAGHHPVVYDNLSRGHEWAVRWGPLVKGELGDSERLRWALDEHSIDTLMHFAAFAYVGESIAKPGLYFENNVVNSLRLFQAMEKSGVRRIVFSSTCATYGSPLRMPIDETHSQSPVSPYGESKLFVEKALRWYGQIHGFRWVTLRYFNAAGADPEGEIGECHEPETHLIPLALYAALDSTGPVSIFGTDYPTPDGTAIRDYIHVTDLASAHVRALDYLVAGGESRALNLGGGAGHTVKQVIETVAHVTGRWPATREDGRRPGDPPVLVADATCARRVLSWEPRHSSLETIVETAAAWHSSRWRTSHDNSLGEASAGMRAFSSGQAPCSARRVQGNTAGIVDAAARAPVPK